MQLHVLLGALVAASTAAQCLDLLAESRRRAGFRAVGFRDAVRVPIFDRVSSYFDWATHAGWPAALMKNWGEVAPSLPDGAPLARHGEVTVWRLPDLARGDVASPTARRAVQQMRDAGLGLGVTVRVPRPFGQTGCVTWFGPEQSELDPEARTLLPALTATFFSSFDRVSPGATRGLLTDREIDCLRWAALGKTDKEIARLIDRSTDTVRFHMKSIMRKLGTSNRTHAVALSVHAGLVSPVADESRTPGAGQPTGAVQLLT
jgi:DNA-binding CsgD family transcriptional regulator